LIDSRGGKSIQLRNGFIKMYQVCERNKFLATLSVAFILLLGTSAGHAAPLAFDFTLGFSEADAGFGNTLEFSDTTDAHTVLVTSWSDAGGTQLNTANGQQLAAGGLGVCNTVEGLGCETAWMDRSIDNSGGRDWMLLIFDQTMDISSFVITPDLNPARPNQKQDVDVSIFVGTLSEADADLAGRTYADLSSVLNLSEYANIGGNTRDPVTVDVTALAGGAVWGNAILIGALRTETDDLFTLTGISTVVPVPPAIWLFMSALGALFARRQPAK
jgi:hypothetical protein